jgi:2-polyprenyl-3-methyl-5-hydroxy-6-metoxy-1,4-benzoquinol methylase
MQKVTYCNLCGSKYSSAIFIEDGIEILKCKECGLEYSGFIPERAFERKDEPKKISDETKNSRMHIYISVLKDLKLLIRSGRLLDVGCRTGNFLIESAKYGFNSTGVELSEEFASYARSQGLDVISGTLKHNEFLDKSFDAITYLAVFEHISAPSEELREVHRILKDEGLLVLEIPNFTFNIIKAKISILFKIKPGLMPLNHLIHYSKDSIHRMLEKNGFQIERLKAECSAEGREGTFLAKIYMYFSPLFRSSPIKWILCNDMIIIAKKLSK